MLRFEKVKRNQEKAEWEKKEKDMKKQIDLLSLQLRRQSENDISGNTEELMKFNELQNQFEIEKKLWKKKEDEYESKLWLLQKQFEDIVDR